MSERITVFDIEVLNDDPASVCSIGIVVMEDLRIIEEYYTLIRPRNTKFDPYRFKVHHIKPQRLIHEKTFRQVWSDIAHYFENQIVVSHDIQTDMSHMRAAMKVSRLPYPSLKMSCTNVLAHLFYPEREKYNLSDLCSDLQIELKQAHQALEDARACSDLLVRMMTEAGFDSLARLHRHYHIAFGEMKVNYYRNIVAPDLVTHQQTGVYPLSNVNVAFTGEFSISHAQLDHLNERAHIHASSEVNTHTNYLVVGSINYGKIRYGGNNKKVTKALNLIDQGQDLKIISEKQYVKLVSTYITKK
ncbi:MAG: 3'-5' exoribonuclease [Erysipelotrichaceae bacterium]|nr:3'-5' exoribonuclease [Erysipelotrichaceae bacterium]